MLTNIEKIFCSMGIFIFAVIISCLLSLLIAVTYTMTKNLARDANHPALSACERAFSLPVEK